MCKDKQLILYLYSSFKRKRHEETCSLFEYAYNDKNQIIEKKALKWDGSKWMNYYCITVTYMNAEAHIQYFMWDKKSQHFQPTEKYVYGLEEAGRFLA